MLRTDGYLFHPNLITFNVKTDIFLLSDSKIDEITEKRLNAKNFGFYDLTVSFLPKQNTNVTFYSMLKQTERSEKVLDKAFSIVPVNYYSETNIGRTGITLKRSSKNRIPDFIVTANVLSARNDSSILWKRNMLDFKILNDNPAQNVSYSLNYKLYDYDSDYHNINDIKYEIDFISNAELAESSNLSARGKFIKYSSSDNLIGDLRHYYNPSRNIFNDFSLRFNQFKYDHGENISYKLQNRVRFDNNNTFKYRLAINYNYRNSNSVIGSSISQTGYIKPELIINKQNKNFNFHGILTNNLGIIKNDSDTDITNNSIGNFRLTSKNLKKIKISLTENIGYFTFTDNVKMIRSKSGAELLINLSYRLSTGGFVSFENTNYYSSNLNSFSRILFKGIINIQPTKNLRVKYENYYTFNYTKNLNDIIRNRITVSQTGLINNAVIQMTAEQVQIGNTYSRKVLNASISYRVMKFILTGGYWINMTNDIRFDEYRIMIRRPIGINL